MSKAVSLRLRESQVDRLSRVARRTQRPSSETAAILLDESLRMAEYPHIVFKDTAIGRQAFVSGTRLKVWQLINLLRRYDDDVASVADDLDLAPFLIEAAIHSGTAFSEEIEAAIQDYQSLNFEKLKQQLPNLEAFYVDIDAEPASLPILAGESAAEAGP
ncbi:MAG: hypothetical protein M3Z66_11380 [Chloroflexota bacterium]|nr:hypothetical protein [Chloroflexota bacterium]